MRIWKRLLGLALCLCAAVCLMSVSASAEGEHTEHPICGANHENIGDHTGTCNDVTCFEQPHKKRCPQKRTALL